MSNEPIPAHLEPIWTDRGFKHMPAIQGRDEDEVVKVYESSAADGPHVWLRVEEDRVSYASAHLTLEHAAELRDQLDYLIRNHYQLEP